VFLADGIQRPPPAPHSITSVNSVNRVNITSHDRFRCGQSPNRSLQCRTVCSAAAAAAAGEADVVVDDGGRILAVGRHEQQLMLLVGRTNIDPRRVHGHVRQTLIHAITLPPAAIGRRYRPNSTTSMCCGFVGQQVVQQAVQHLDVLL